MGLRNLPTATIATSTLVDINIFTFYNEFIGTCGGGDSNFVSLLPNTLKAKIQDNVGTENSVKFIECDLIMTMKNYPSFIDYWIDADDNLIVQCEDNKRYYIDEDGFLIYDFCAEEVSMETSGYIINDLDEYLVTDLSEYLIYDLSS